MLKVKNTVTEMKNTFYRIISRLDRVKKIISKTDDRPTEITQTETEREKKNFYNTKK